MEIKVSGGVHNSCHRWDREGGQMSKYTAYVPLCWSLKNVSYKAS